VFEMSKAMLESRNQSSILLSLSMLRAASAGGTRLWRSSHSRWQPARHGGKVLACCSLIGPRRRGGGQFHPEPLQSVCYDGSTFI
jgi:hypothetical protein